MDHRIARGKPSKAAMMTRIGYTIALVAVLVAIGGCQLLEGLAKPKVKSDPRMTSTEPTPEQREQLDRADMAKSDGDYDLALALFQDILAENPTIVTGYLGIGDIYMIRSQFDKSEQAYKRASRLEPRNFDAQYGHGLALHMLERYSDAVQSFHKALTIDPDSLDANLSLATTYLSMNESRRALVFAEKAVELDPSNGAARANLGAIYEMLGRNRDAIDEYIAASERMGNPAPQLMMNLINVLAKEKRYQEVINHAQNVLRVEESANAYERLGYAHFKLADYDQSLAAYRAAVRLDARHWQSLNGIGVNMLNRWLLSKKRDNEAKREARDAFRQSLRANEDQPKVVQLLSSYRL